MKAIGIGVGTLVVGYLLSMFLANFFTAAAPEIGSTYIGFIGFSILYLATVIAICTYALIKHKKKLAAFSYHTTNWGVVISLRPLYFI